MNRQPSGTLALCSLAATLRRSHPPMPCLRRLLIDVACSWLLLGLAGPVWADPLSQQVRSLLSNRCFACHGPDAQQREGGLRLDDRGSYLSPADSGQPPVVPGDVAGSTLWQRVVADDPDQRMPPALSWPAAGRR